MIAHDQRQIRLAQAISDATFKCTECQEPVFWAQTYPGGKSILLDAAQGEGFVVRMGIGKIIALADKDDYLEGSHHRSHWARCKPSAPRHGMSLERVDDDELIGPGLYRGLCDCGWESNIRSYTLVGDEFRAHIEEAG